MKKTESSKPTGKESNDMLPEYKFNYGEARPNRFAARIQDIEDERIVIRPVEVRTGKGGQRRSSKERQAAYAILDEISRKMNGEDPEVIEETVKEAVKAARKK